MCVGGSGLLRCIVNQSKAQAVTASAGGEEREEINSLRNNPDQCGPVSLCLMAAVEGVGVEVQPGAVFSGSPFLSQDPFCLLRASFFIQRQIRT